MSKCKVENGKLKINNFLPLQWRGKNFLATSELKNSGEGLSFSKITQLPLLTGEGRGEVATRSADCHPELDSGSINAGRETFKDKSLLTHPFNILFSSPSLVLEFKTKPISTKNLPAQGLRKQYIEQENNLPLSKGEDAVVLAQASYKCGVRVHPVGFHSVSEANKTIFHFPLSIFHSREVNHAKH